MTFKIFVFQCTLTCTLIHMHMQRWEVKRMSKQTKLRPLLYFSRQCCLPGDDGWSVFLGRDVWQNGPQTVPPHLHVHEWLLRLPLIFCPGIWPLSPLPSSRRLWVSLVTWSQFCRQARMARNVKQNEWTFYQKLYIYNLMVPEQLFDKMKFIRD